GEDADAERVLEVSTAADTDDLVRDLRAVERIDAGRQPELRHVHGDAAFQRAGRARARVEHLVPSRAVIVAAWGGADLGVDGGRLGVAADLLGRALDALGEDVAEALAPADHLDQTIGALDVTPPEPEAELLFGDEPALLALHHPATHPAELVDVEAGAVELR